MSKAKNNNKNKVTKMPVKGQQMKQKPIVNKNFKEVKAAPVAMSKVLANNAAKGIKKEDLSKNLKEKKIVKPKKDLDILESCDDDDESSVVSEEIGTDSDMDDVDLEDSDDVQGESDDDDALGLGDDSDDLQELSDDEDLDNSDLESMEMDESKVNELGSDEESNDETPVANKATTETKSSKKQEAKAVKVVDQTLKKEKLSKETIPKNVKKETTKVEVKAANVAKVVSKVTNADENILNEVNLRKNMLSNCSIFLNKLHPTLTRESLTAFLQPTVSVVQSNVPKKVKSKGYVNRGYAFIRLANEADADKAIKILDGKDVNGTKISASKFVCKKVFDDMSKIELCRIVVNSYKNEDITTELKTHFKIPVIKHLITQYEMTFPTEEDAAALFQKKTMTLNGRELLFNYLYSIKPRPSASESEEIAEVKETQPVKVEIVPIKAGMKRTKVDSDDESQETQVKKTKLNNGSTVVKKVQVQKPKIEIKKEDTKKPVEVKKVTEVKKETQKFPQNKKAFNKAGGDKKQNVKAQGNKPVAKIESVVKVEKSPVNKKPFNKQGNKKPFNKKN